MRRIELGATLPRLFRLSCILRLFHLCLTLDTSPGRLFRTLIAFFADQLSASPLYKTYYKSNV
jgi:hypothetical protein